MTENEKINGWTFEETIKTVENVMEVENNMFKWDVLRHLRDFTESFKYELEQYRAIGTVEEFEQLLEYRAIGSVDRIKGSIEANYVLLHAYESIGTIDEFKALKEKSIAKKQGNINDFDSHLRLSKAGFLCCSSTNKDIRYPLISLRDLEYCPRCGQTMDWE